MNWPKNLDSCNSQNTICLSDSESRVQSFYDRWIGGTGFLSQLGRIIFGLSGIVYSRCFIQAAELRPQDRVMEIGAGLGEILLASQRSVLSRQHYVGIDLSYQMVRRAQKNRVRHQQPIDFLVASAVQIPFQSPSFDVILLSHLVKYLTDAQLRQVLSQVRHLLRPHGRIVLWEFKPYPWTSINRTILRGSGSHRLRSASEVADFLHEQGYHNIQPFRIHTPWPPFRNLAYTAHLE